MPGPKALPHFGLRCAATDPDQQTKHSADGEHHQGARFGNGGDDESHIDALAFIRASDWILPIDGFCDCS